MDATIPEWAAGARIVGRCNCTDAGRHYEERAERQPVYDSPPLDAVAAIAWARNGGVPGRIIGYQCGQVTRSVTCAKCGTLLAVG